MGTRRIPLLPRVALSSVFSSCFIHISVRACLKSRDSISPVGAGFIPARVHYIGHHSRKLKENGSVEDNVYLSIRRQKRLRQGYVKMRLNMLAYGQRTVLILGLLYRQCEDRIGL